MGLLEQAEELLRRIPDAVDTVTKLTKLANQGFISISRKQKERGVSEYEAAISGFKADGKAFMGLYATTYLARALARAGFVGDAEKKQNEIRKAVETSGQSATKHIFRSTELWIAAFKHRQDANLV